MSDSTHTGGGSDQPKGIVYEGPHVHQDHIHVTPALPMTVVFIVLLFLTVITVLTAHYIDIPGTGNLILALVIAIVKGTLVMAYFMHLKYDKGMPLIVVYATFFGVVLFLGLTMADLASRNQADKLHASEINVGGRLDINNQLAKKLDKTGEMNVAEWARQNAKATDGNPPHDDNGSHDENADAHGGAGDGL